MTSSGTTDQAPAGSSAYWRDLVFSRLLPALFFSLFLARQLLLLAAGLSSLRQPTDYLFALQQLLALAYFTLLFRMFKGKVRLEGEGY